MKYNVTCAALVVLKSTNLHGTWNVPNNPICHICKDQKPPGNPYGAASILLPGTKPIAGIYKCSQLYNMGLNNQITSQMCNPIRYYMQNICECGKEFKVSWVARPPKHNP